MRYIETIGASGVFRTTIPGRLFLLEATGAAASVDVELLRNGSSFFNVPGAKRGLRVYSEGFDGLSITAAAGTVVTFYLANEDVQLSFADGATVSMPGGVTVNNAVGAPVPVNIVAGGSTQAVNGPATQGRASVTNSDSTLIAADVARRWLLIQNNDTAAVLRVHVDGNAASATSGFRVQPGGAMEVPQFCVTGAIHACMETATAALNNVEFVSV